MMTVGSPRIHDHVDWAAVNAVRSENEEVRRLFEWLGNCIANERAEAFPEG